jgi:AcrR family transcriptional regulator
LLATGLFSNEARNLGKSARTRAKLMDAAVELFARDGFKAASVNEIAKLADMANGTFYVHFRDKREIVQAVTLGIAQELARQLDEAMVDVDDAVERVSMATRRFLDLALTAPDWGRAFFRAAWAFRDLRENMLSFLRADLERGREQGAFTVEIDDVLIDTFASMIMGALFGRLAGDFGPEAGARVAELQLRMLGVPPQRAHAVANRQLPELRLTITALPKQLKPYPVPSR